MLKNFFPNKILSINSKFFNNLIILMIIIISLGVIYSLFISPPDYIQGDAVRIMYVHVPSSFIAYWDLLATTPSPHHLYA